MPVGKSGHAHTCALGRCAGVPHMCTHCKEHIRACTGRACAPDRSLHPCTECMCVCTKQRVCLHGGDHVRMPLLPPGVHLCDVTPCGGTCTVCVCTLQPSHTRVCPQHACALTPDPNPPMSTCLHEVSKPTLSFITPLPRAPFGNGCAARTGRREKQAALATGKGLLEDAPAGRGTHARCRTVCTSLFALGWAVTADDVAPS